MVTLSLKISLEGGKVVKTIQFEPTTTVYDACRVIREKILEANANDPKEYGLFLASEEDNKKGIWLEASRSLDYYMLRNGDLLEYNKKTRNLRVRMLDGTVKTLLVDDSQIVANLMVVICTKIGITNYDEYGLVREEQKEEADPCEKPNYGTLTLKRRHHEKERDAKMEQLRKKLRTDDEVNWVEPSKTLREQGIETSETLLLRRRLFFSDRNVDSRDPVQLTLLYVQARDAILAGTHPITQDKACEFAGIQCQIQFGDHKEDKHTTGFLDLKEFLPASYMKVKGIEKKVFREQRKHAGLSELDAKVLYTKSARDLKTYGVAFFLVKEKMKGKNKLVPRLLGVTKDSVLRLDEKTKEILQTWPLTTVRRWCASQNTFTLDFGDYSDQYYSVQTTEAEQILQVISGYIDIIVRRRRAAARLGLDGDEGSAMLEDTVHPSKANIIQHDTFKSGKVNQESVAKPAVLRPGAEGAKPFSVGVAGGALQSTLSGRAATGHAPPATTQVQQTKITSILTEPQRALLSTITSGKEIIKQTEAGLTRTVLEPPGSDAISIQWRESRLGSSKQLVTSHIAAMSAATAQVVTLTAGPTEEVDHTAVGAAITTITTNLPEMTKGVQMIAALMEDENSGDNLLDATRKLCSAFSDLLKATEPDAKEPRQSLLNAASRVGEASTGVLHTMGEETEQDKETQDILLSLAKAVANTTAALVLKAKNVAAQCKDEQPLQNTIIAAATHCALATSQLVACAKVVAPSLHSPACRSQLSAAARQVAQAVERLVAAGEGAPAAAAPALDQLMAAAKRVTDELERLLAHCDLDRRVQPTVMEQSVESVMCASESVTEAADAPEMVRRARLLGQATARLIADIKTEAENQPSDSQRKLLAAAKLLADATARMVEAARLCASLPQDREKQEALRRAAEELKLIAVDYAEHQGAPGRQQARLAESARQATSSATQLITSAHNATHYNTNKYSQESLLSECVSLGERSSRLAQAARCWGAAPDDPAAGLALFSAADTFLQPSGHVIQAARGVLPTVSDAATAKQLADTTHMFTASCADLRSSTSRARSSGRGGELDAAEHVLRSLQQELDELEAAIGDLQLKPLPGHTREWACGRLQTTGRSAASAGAQLAAGARRGDGAVAARAGSELAAALQDFTPPLRAALAVASEPQQRKVLSYGRQVVSSSLTLVRRVQAQLAGAPPDHDDLMALARDVSENIEQTIESVPSHAELDAALDSIAQTLGVLDMGEFPGSDRPYGELQTELTSAAVELNSASARVAEGAVSDSLPPAAENFLTSFDRLVAVGLEMAGRTEETESRMEMVGSLKTVTVNSTKLLTTAKSVSQEPARPNARNELAAAARAVTDAINALVDACTEAAPGQKECAAAARSIASARTLLAAPAQPLSDLGYFACLDAVVDHSKTLSEGMSGMAGAVKVGAGGTERLCHSVRTVASAVQGLVECAAQAAYLVAVSDESSVAGRAGLVDQAQFARAAAAIDTACGALADPRAQQHQVLSAATAIAKHTSALCNACRAASARCNEPQSKRHFVQAAKDVANCTASLVKEIKALDADYCEANLSRCAAATRPLQDAVRSLRQFADSPEFAAVPARISAQARDNQEAILQCGRGIISESCAMVEAARALALNSTERTHWHTLAHHSKAVSDTIKSLVTNIREKAPGQRECEAALSLVALQQRALERAALHAAGLELQPQPGNTLQGYSEQIENSLAEILERVEPLLLAARSEAEHLGHAVTQLVSYAEPLVSGTVGAASHMTESSAQSSLLQHAITVLETLSLLVQAAKHAAGNPRALSAHGEAQAQAVLARSALAELSARVRDLSLQAGAVRPLLESVARAVARLTEHRMSLIGSYDEADSFVDYQTRMVGVAKEIAHLASDMTAKAATEPSRLVEVGNTMVGKYERLAADSVGAAATTPNADIANRIRVSAVELGECVSELVRAGGHCRLAATTLNQRAVADHARRVGEKVVSILSALQAGSRGTQACIDAAATIATILGDLDTTILFASAGTLQSDTPGDTFSNHRENILKTAKTLVEDTKTLVSGAAGSQDQLAAAAQSAVATIVQLCSVVKAGATSLGAGGPEPQVLVLHAARDAAAALRDLAAATAAASGKHVAGQDMQRLKHAAKRLSDPKRRSLPVRPDTVPRIKRRSVQIKDYNSCDSETDIFQSDQEDELLKLLDYSSHDDDVSPTIFHDSCEELIAYFESKMIEASARLANDDVNLRYNLVCRNSLFDMDSRVLKYGETIFLSELRKLVDLFLDCMNKGEKRQRRKAEDMDKASSDLDNEMKRLSQVMDDLDFQSLVIEKNQINTTIHKVSQQPTTDKTNLKSPTFKVKKVKPINLVVNLEMKSEPVDTPITNTPQPDDNQGGDGKEPIVLNKDTKIQFWKMFKDDSEWWEALARRNLEKMEETRRELERFSGHELVIGEIKTEIDKNRKEKETLESFIDDVDTSRMYNRVLEYDKKYEDIVLRLIEFAKKDFVYTGFDPLIKKLKSLANIQIERRNKKVNIQDIIDIYTKIDISQYTYEELCLLEKYYKEIIRKYNNENRGKENLFPVSERDDTKSAPPSFNRKVFLNVHSHHNHTKNVNNYTTNSLTRNSILKRPTHNQNDQELLDLTRTYPSEYYANNWWKIYEDVLKNREQQFGTIDNWWNFYEAILNKTAFTKEDSQRMRSIVEHRARRPHSRMEEQLRMLEDVQHSRFKESEGVETDGNESVMVTNVTSLLKTVKAVEDEHTRGTRALESTIEAISQELEVLWSPSATTSSVEELVRCARLMTAATSRAVAASGQDQLTAAANLGRRTVLDVLAAARGAAHAADTDETRRRTLESAQAVAESYRALLGALLAPARAQLPDLSRRVAQAVADVLAAAELLKGSEWVDPADPTVIAEQELLGAAASIDAAARKLDALRPRTQTTKQETDENLNFDEMILEAAKSIIAATSALVRAAGAAQRELTDRDGAARRPAPAADDGQWSEGLVSAARLVAAATHALVEAANALVQGAATEERLISSARQVASSTAQLLVACQVKADPGSDSSRRLRAAGAGVIRSTDNLVRAARDAIAGDDERSLVLNRRMVGGIAQEIDARSEVLRIEKELEEARGRLTAIRQAKYKLRDTSGDDTDTDQPGDTSDASGPGNRFKTPNSSFNTTYTPNSTFTQNTTHNTTHSSTLNTTHNTQNSTQNISLNQSYSQNGLGQDKSPSFSSFRPQDETPKNYEGFTTRVKTTNDRTMSNDTRSMSEEPVVVRSLRLPEVRTAVLVEESTRVYYKRAPPPPPRRTHNYETRLYDTPRPVEDYYKTDERRHYETNQSYKEQKFGYETPKAAPMSPKFNARDMKFDEKPEPLYSTLKKPAAFEDLGQNYSEHHKSTEKIPGGTKHSEYTVRSESYQSNPRTEFFKTETRQEVKSPFATSTPSKFDRPDAPEFPKPTLDIVKAPTPDYDRISSPYGKDVHSYGGPNFFEETTTEVKEIPNGTQKITTTKIYSSSPVNMTTTNTKYEPIKLEGLDELSKSFDNDSKYSTLDSRFNTLESKLSSDTSRSFMRPSEFQSSDFQATSSVSKTKPSDLLKEIDSMDRKFSKQTISSEIIEKKSVMTSSHKSETSSTVTKKFGNF